MCVSTTSIDGITRSSAPRIAGQYMNPIERERQGTNGSHFWMGSSRRQYQTVTPLTSSGRSTATSRSRSRFELLQKTVT